MDNSTHKIKMTFVDYIGILKLISSEKSLTTYYKEIFNLKKYGGFNLNEINDMIPYEFEIYQYQTLQALEEERNKNT